MPDLGGMSAAAAAAALEDADFEVERRMVDDPAASRGAVLGQSPAADAKRRPGVDRRARGGLGQDDARGAGRGGSGVRRRGSATGGPRAGPRPGGGGAPRGRRHRGDRAAHRSATDSAPSSRSPWAWSLRHPHRGWRLCCEAGQAAQASQAAEAPEGTREERRLTVSWWPARGPRRRGTALTWSAEMLADRGDARRGLLHQHPHPPQLQRAQSTGVEGVGEQGRVVDVEVAALHACSSTR